MIQPVAWINHDDPEFVRFIATALTVNRDYAFAVHEESLCIVRRA